MQRADLLRINRRVAQRVLGRAHGRPTLSRRAGRQIASLTGLSLADSIELFHVGAVVLVLALIAKAKDAR